MSFPTQAGVIWSLQPSLPQSQCLLSLRISLGEPWLAWWCASFPCVASLSFLLWAWPGREERAKGVSNALVCQAGCALISGAEDLPKAGEVHSVTLWEGESRVLVSMSGAYNERISAARRFFSIHHSPVAAFHGPRVRLSIALVSRLSSYSGKREAGLLPAPLPGALWCY